MKRLLLAFTFVSLAIAATSALMSPAYPATAGELGDLSPYQAIVANTLDLTNAGDIPAARKRITDFETAWDEATAQMRPLNPEKWTAIDHAADAAIDALRTTWPNNQKILLKLNALLVVLDSKGTTPGAAPAVNAKFSVTNPDGSPVPCEVTLQKLRDITASVAPASADQAKFDTLKNKGIERCNADDDQRANGFFMEALALVGH
jgi:hypothetical protein